jgi:hypothetical protein
MSRLALIFALGFLAACTAQPRPTSQENVNLSGFPQAFKNGYSDGCASRSGPTVRSESRFKSDPQYAQGWRDGFDICARR